MRLRDKIVLSSILVVISLAAAWEIKFTFEQRAADKARAERELGYAATAAKLGTFIIPGMLRADAEALLKNRSLSFLNRGREDNVPPAHEPSGHWYCSYDQVQVLITFNPGDTATGGRRLYVDDEALTNDRVKSVTLDHWLQDCM
jgi:hypothetical protein